MGGLLARLGVGRLTEEVRPGAGSLRNAEDRPVVNSRAFPKFLACLGSRPAPVLLDLGPAVGTNLTFLGDQLNCKIYVEDLLADVDRHQRDGNTAELPAYLSKRFVLDAGAVDGVLLWDVCDYLDRPAASALAATLVRLLADDGVLLGFFGSGSPGRSGFTKFVIDDESHLRQHWCPSAAIRQDSPPNRDIIKMFDGLGVSDSFLMKDGLREILFRKGAGGRPII